MAHISVCQCLAWGMLVSPRPLLGLICMHSALRACEMVMGTGNQLITHSELSIFVTKGRFPRFARYEASAPGKIYLLAKIPVSKC